jgi:ABC-type branched-subunit amino acid transport system substrate-binding protein
MLDVYSRASSRYARGGAAGGAFGAADWLVRLDPGFATRRAHPLRVGLFVPTSGAAGIWGPSTIACARLAAAELNDAGGVLGREVILQVVDAASENPLLLRQTRQLLADNQIDTIVGMHLSSVRKALLPAVAGRVPYVYTPLYEGGERHPGVFTLGETPLHQLVPALAALSERRTPTRWALIGNDYVWPRISHRYAREVLRRLRCPIVQEAFLPLGCNDFQPTVDRLAQSGAQAVLLSLIGQDAVDFNRAFAASGLPGRVRRLSCAIEENELLAIGADHTEELYVAGSYFATLATEANLAFRERYHSHLRARAPTLNGLGQSTYEGVHFLAALVSRASGPPRPGEPLRFRSARGAVWRGNDRLTCPVFLARAEGHALEVVRTLSASGD